MGSQNLHKSTKKRLLRWCVCIILISAPPSINGCKKDINAECKRGYSRDEIVSETFVNKGTNRVVYRRRTKNDLLIVPYNLQMMMDWDSHINVEYSGSAYCALYLYKKLL